MMDATAAVDSIFAKVWVFGQLVLFSMLGSKTDTSILPKVFEAIPVRLTFCNSPWRDSHHRSSDWLDIYRCVALWVFLASLSPPCCS